MSTQNKDPFFLGKLKSVVGSALDTGSKIGKFLDIGGYVGQLASSDLPRDLIDGIGNFLNNAATVGLDHAVKTSTAGALSSGLDFGTHFLKKKAMKYAQYLPQQYANYVKSATEAYIDPMINQSHKYLKRGIRNSIYGNNIFMKANDFLEDNGVTPKKYYEDKERKRQREAKQRMDEQQQVTRSLRPLQQVKYIYRQPQYVQQIPTSIPTPPRVPAPINPKPQLEKKSLKKEGQVQKKQIKGQNLELKKKKLRIQPAKQYFTRKNENNEQKKDQQFQSFESQPQYIKNKTRLKEKGFNKKQRKIIHKFRVKRNQRL